eukprot:15430206-Alexandrium_andersonii.AAC.1
MAARLARQAHFMAVPLASFQLFQCLKQMFMAALTPNYSLNIAGKWPLGPSGKILEQSAGPSDPFQGRPAGQLRTSAERRLLKLNFMAALTPNYLRNIAGNLNFGRPGKT